MAKGLNLISRIGQNITILVLCVLPPKRTSQNTAERVFQTCKDPDPHVFLTCPATPVWAELPLLIMDL